MIRQREDSATAFDVGGRPELAAKERAEIEVIRGFLPKQMSAEEIRAAVQEAIAADRRGLGPRHGQGHGALKERHAGKLDFGKASALVKGLLGA